MSRLMLSRARMMHVVEKFMINWVWTLKRLRRDFGRLCVAPRRRFRAVSPVAWTIKCVHADAVELAHFADPPRMHPTGVVVGRLADIVEPELAVQRLAGDVLGALPGGRLVDAVGDAVAGEGELAGQVTARILVDHAANRVGVIAGEYPVHYHLGDRHLSADRFPPGFEVDRLGKAFLLLGAGSADEAEAFGRALRLMFYAGHLAFRRYGLIARRFEWRRDIRGYDCGFLFFRLEYGGLSRRPRLYFCRRAAPNNSGSAPSESNGSKYTKSKSSGVKAAFGASVRSAVASSVAAVVGAGGPEACGSA